MNMTKTQALIEISLKFYVALFVGVICVTMVSCKADGPEVPPSVEHYVIRKEMELSAEKQIMEISFEKLTAPLTTDNLPQLEFIADHSLLDDVNFFNHFETGNVGQLTLSDYYGAFDVREFLRDNGFEIYPDDVGFKYNYQWLEVGSFNQSNQNGICLNIEVAGNNTSAPRKMYLYVRQANYWEELCITQRN